MKILLLTQWYLPEPAKLLSDLTKTLQKTGHEVTVLTGFPNYPSGKLYPGYSVKPWQRETIQGVPVIRVPLIPDHSNSIKRAWNYLSFAMSASILGPCLAPHFDLMHVFHPPLTVGWPALVLSRLRRVPFTYEIQDLWPETLEATGMVKNRRVLSGIDRFARRVYRRAAAIRVISPGFRENLIGKGVPSEKIHVISNWVDGDFYRPVPPDPRLADHHGMTGKFNVMFAGTIGLAQGVDTILQAAALVQDLPAIQFVLVGDGADYDRVRREAAEGNLRNVKFLGRMPPDAMPGLFALADVLLVHLRDDPLFRITVPHKIFTYMAVAKPVLAAMEGDAADVVRSAQSGLICPPSNPTALAETVRRFYSMTAEERGAIGANGRRAICDSYNRDFLVGRMIAMFESVLKMRSGRAHHAPQVSEN
jgi:colanic acid biosynthesis glycosyl transferase WcaI